MVFGKTKDMDKHIGCLTQCKTSVFILFNAKEYSKFRVHSVIKSTVPKMFTDCIDASCSGTPTAQILFHATLEFRKV